jgi:hypothetical protein
MTRGCLLGLGFFIVVFAAYYFALQQVVEFGWPGDLIAAALAGLFATVFLSSIVGIVQAWRDARRIWLAGEHKPPQDGEVVAVVGTIRPINAALISPLAGKPCVAYDYEVSHVDRRRQTTGRTTVSSTSNVYDIAGLALTPSIIDTPYGGVRLLSFALLDAFPRERFGDPASRQRAAAYAAATTFKSMGVTKVFTAFNALEQALTDDDGAVRIDWRMAASDSDLSNAISKGLLAERTVGVGETVCAIGRYSAARHGLFSDGPTSIVRLTPGDAKKARAAVIKNARSSFAMATLFFVVSHGMLGAAVYMGETRYRRETPSQQFSVINDAMQSQDVAQLARVIRRGADPNVRDQYGKSPLHVTHSATMAKALIQSGASVNATDNYGETPLMLAAMQGDVEMVQALLANGAAAGVNIARRDGATALSDALGSDTPTAPAAVALLVAAGAKSDVVTAQNGGEPLPPDGGEPFEVVRAYIAAIHAGDLQGLYATTWHRPPHYYDDIDFGLWHKIHPEQPVFLEGFATRRAATLAVGGPNLMHVPITWHFQLVHGGETWQILRDWDTRQATQTSEPVERGGQPTAPAKPPGSSEPVERPRAR